MGDKPKALSEWVTREDANGKLVIDKNKMVCYAYLNKKGKLKDKGVRVDGSDPSINNGEPISYVLEPGMVMRCMMKKSGAIGGTDKEKRESFFPSDLDVIPAFSRLVVKLACKVRSPRSARYVAVRFCFATGDQLHGRAGTSTSKVMWTQTEMRSPSRTSAHVIGGTAAASKNSALPLGRLQPTASSSL